jgi:hypothetical protein
VADWAESGVVPLTGLPDGPPVMPPGAAATAAARLLDWYGVLSAAAGVPVILDGRALLAERAALTGARRQGSLSAGGSCHLLAAADGVVAVSLARPDDAALVAAMVEHDLTGSPRDEMSAWAAGRPTREVVAAGALLGLAVSEVGAEGRPGPAGDAARLAGAAARADPGSPLPDGMRPGARWERPPLVVDFSALWAGPLCAHLLGLAGASVIKVETASRPDGARLGHRGFYDLLHGGHAAVQVDPADPADGDFLHSLVAAADVVIEASRPRALAAWGLSAEQVAAAGTVWISITAYGRTGEAAQRIGFGDDVAAGAGLVGTVPGHPLPVFAGDALADPLAGITAAVLAIEALGQPGGRLIEVPMAAVAAATLDGTPSTPAVREAAGWRLATSAGPVVVRAPQARPPVSTAPPPGADTARVRARLAGGQVPR